jgi:hypothetical protein
MNAAYCAAGSVTAGTSHATFIALTDSRGGRTDTQGTFPHTTIRAVAGTPHVEPSRQATGLHHPVNTMVTMPSGTPPLDKTPGVDPLPPSQPHMAETVNLGLYASQDCSSNAYSGIGRAGFRV